MERDGFKRILKKHFKTCERLIADKGCCKNVDCKDCPFSSKNSFRKLGCGFAGYSDIFTRGIGPDKKLVQSCKSFINKFSKGEGHGQRQE